MTIGGATNFAEDEIGLGLGDDVHWRQCFARLGAAYDSPGNQLLLTQATRVTQLALHGNRLLEDQAAGQARLRSVSTRRPSEASPKTRNGW
jgi:hypothetical protein